MKKFLATFALALLVIPFVSDAAISSRSSSFSSGRSYSSGSSFRSSSSSFRPSTTYSRPSTTTSRSINTRSSSFTRTPSTRTTTQTANTGSAASTTIVNNNNGGVGGGGFFTGYLWGSMMHPGYGYGHTTVVAGETVVAQRSGWSIALGIFMWILIIGLALLLLYGILKMISNDGYDYY